MKKSIKKVLYWFGILTVLLLSINANAQWSGVGGGVNNITYALCSDGTNLYVGINNNPFDNTNNYLLKWNGSAWSNLGYVNGSICALAYMGGNVYVGGTFSKANGVAGYNNIAAWNVGSSSWSTLGTGTNSYVTSLTVSGSTLYVGGNFTTANGVTSNYVASWSAGAWSTINPGGGAGVNGIVWALTVLGGNLYVGGQFSATTSGTAASNIVEWNGAAWSALTSGLSGAVTVNNIATTQDQIAANPDPTVMALTNDGTNLYVGGDFTTAGGTAGFHNIAEWNGSAWSKLGVGMSAPGVSTGNANGDNANVYALTMYNGNLIAGGDFGTAGTYTTAYGIAQWNGSAWIGFSASCGSNINSDVFALCVSNGSLFAGGQFPNPYIYVAQYTGAGPTISVGAAPAATICQGDNTGLSASGATTYKWSPSSSLNVSTGANVTASPTVTTTYSVVGTTGGCSNTQTLVVTVNPSPTMTVTNSTPTICGGVGTSTLTITAGNATGYTWGPAGSLSVTTGTVVTATPTVTTTYTVTATGANTCVSTQTLVVSVNPTPTVSITSSPPTICSGTSTVLSASGATTYSWSPAVGATTSTVSVSPGSTTTYTVTGTTGGCTSGQQTIVVTVNPSPTIIASGATTICSGNSTVISASGATTYTWSPAIGATTSTVSVSPGSTTTYTVTGTTAGCTSAPQTVKVTVTPTPTVTLSAPPTICSGNSTTLTASGATTYIWTPGGSTGSTLSVSPGSTSTYTVTGSNGACPGASPATVVVTVNPTPTLTLSAPPTICSGNSTTLTASGASTYLWQPGFLSGSTVSVSPGSTKTYTVTGTASGCNSAPATIVVTVNATPTLGVSGPVTICAGGATTLTGSGASTYLWQPGALTTSTISVTPGATITYTLTGSSAAACPAAPATVVVTVSSVPTVTVSAGPSTICSGNSSTLTASGATTYSWQPGALSGSTVSVSPGATTTYTVVGTLAGCASSAPETVVVTVNPTPTVSALAGPATICSGNSTVLTGSGATTYTWSPGGITGSTISVSPGSTTTYSVTGTTTGCSNVIPSTVVVTVNATPTLGISGPVTICAGGSTTLTGSGASTYQWQPGALTTSTISVTPGATTTYTLTGSSAAACPAAPASVVVTVSSVPTVTVSAGPATICSGGSSTLTAGGATTYTWQPGVLSGSTVSVSPGATTTYTVVGTLAGCASAAPATVVVTVNPTPTVSLPFSPSICPGGNVNITASGATTYTWTPNTSISASTGATVTANPASTITYTVTGSDAGCNSAPITVVVTVASTMTVSITPTASSICAGGSTILTAGGAATYVWSPATGLSCSTCPNPTANPADTTTYKVVGSSGLCKDSAMFTLIVNPTPTVNIALTGIAAAICPGDSMGMIASGASTYVWTPNTGLSCSTCDTINAGPSVTTTYTLTGTDAGGCTATATQVIIAYPVPVMTINIPKDTICSGNSVILVASGVTSYSWSPPTGLNTTLGDSVIATPGSSTTYIVTGTGTGGCKTKDSSVITVNITPTVSVVPPTPVICSGDSIKLVAGGAPGYTWLPSSGLKCNSCDSTMASPASTVTYSVVGTSVAGCKDTSTITVTVNATPTITVTASNGTTICSNKDTTVVTASGGTTYTWSPSTGLNTTSGSVVDANPTTTVVYTVSTTSAAGCPSSDSIIIAVNPSPTVTAGAIASAICNGTSTILNASGATTYTWIPATGLSSSTGATVNASPGTTQTYSVIGIANGCPDTATVPLAVVTPPVVTATIGSGDSACNGVSKIITASGASSYAWSPGGQTTDSIVVSPTSSTTYTVVGSNGICSDSAIVSIGLYPPFMVSVANDTLCSGRTANITATANGGSAPYTYLWSNGLGTNSSASILVTPGAATYTCNVSNACGQTFPATVVVDGAPTPNAHFTATPDTIPGGQLVGFLNSNSAATSWIWTMGDNTAPVNGDSSIIYQYDQPGTYWIKLVVSNGFCTDTSIESIFVTQGIFIPNVFTPNGDGQNDVFHVTVGGMKKYYIEIFNRWGEKLFQADSPNIDWDGTSSGGIKESDGDYYYLINCTDFENTTFKYHGYIQLIRN